METLPRLFTRENLLDIRVAKNFLDLFLVAKDILSRMPKDLYQVCGPISNGDLGSRSKNIIVFEKTIDAFQEIGFSVFNQVAFEETMWRLTYEYSDKSMATLDYIHCLEEFYLPLFKTGKIKHLLFIPGWQSSTRSNWERKKAEEFGINVYDLPENWVDHYDPNLFKELFPTIKHF